MEKIKVVIKILTLLLLIKEKMEKIKDIKILNYDEILKQLNEKFPNIDKIYEAFEKEVGNNKWTYIPNKNLWFNKEIMACYPNFNINFQNIQIDSNIGYQQALQKIKENSEYRKYDINWDIQTWDESINSFYEKWHPMESNSSNHRINGYCNLIYKSGNTIYRYDNDTNYARENQTGDGLLVSIYRIDSKSATLGEIFKEFLERGLIIDSINQNEELKNKFNQLVDAYKEYGQFVTGLKKHNVVWNKDKIIDEVVNGGDSKKLFDKVEVELIYENDDVEYTTYVFGKKEGKAIYKYISGDVEEYEYHSGVIEGAALYKYANGDIGRLFYTNGVKKDITKLYNLLHIDNIRVNTDKYDENIVLDPNRGHWELFESEDIEEVENSIGKKVYGRDPRLDIKKGGIVGIDFGTKSTVVVFQDDKNITLPMRISGNILNKEVEDSDFENPTVIEFRNLDKFIKEYKTKEGRPITSWEDITVSHTASQNLLNGTSLEFSSIISDLKQWAGSKKENLVVRDKKDLEKVFKPYVELSDEDFDPIEIYAYYIGSYINNMRNGIYLEYYLSFPVTYEKAIRNRILKSFERGIKKSLPVAILKDEEVMKKFKVKHGANEPAAYAVCALQEYGFEPEDEEKVYYGVFDFGGGTLDFDFGIWRASEDERSYDYDIEHFGAGGDRYLGGENILKELAYEVFKENKDILRSKGISFYRPEWCDRFLGDEELVDKSQEAKLNIKKLMEKLRGIWENSYDSDGEKIKVGLFNKKSELIDGIELTIDKENLEKIIEDKIAGGIDNFFIAMNRAFKNEEYDKLYILLAGNSCKHPVVMDKFKEIIEKEKLNIEILPPLGTEQAYEKLQELGMEVDKNDKTKPTGKTGVAYGIVSSRNGGRINVINRDEKSNDNNEINFKFYVGYEARKKFKPVLTPQTGYNNFIYLINVTSDVFDLHYSSLPEASSGKMLIEKVKKERVFLNKEYEDGEKVYIEAISSDKIRCVVTKDDITEKNYLEEKEIVLD